MTTIQYINIVNQCLVIQKPVKMETKTGIFALKNLLCFISVLFITAGILHSQNLAYNTAGNTVSDSRDGSEIGVVEIGGTVWMSENLNFDAQSGCWCYDNKPSNCEVYGKLYEWETALKACPDGWRLPAEAEVLALMNKLGGGDVAGGKMKEKGTAHWTRPNSSATNSSGFTALPAGSYLNGKFDLLGYMGTWWMADEKSKTSAKCFTVCCESGDLFIITNKKQTALSVRCVKD